MKNLITTWLFLTLAATLSVGCGTEEDVDCGDDHASSDAAGDAGSDGYVSDPRTNGAAPSSDAGASSPDAGTSPTPDAGTPPADAGAPPADAGASSPDAGAPAPSSPAPLRSPAANLLRFADAYIGGEASGQVRGNLPGATWSAGPAIADTNADHELELALVAPAAGTYELTYVSATGTWASYGSRSQLLGMTADARAFVNCNWWDAASAMTVTVSSPGCNLRIQIDGTGVITGAGNMRDYR